MPTFEVAIALVLALHPAGPGSAASTSTERIVHAARLWGEVRYYHPWILTRDVDWDAAFIRALPRIEGERDERAGLQALLDELHDPVTTMVADVPAGSSKPAAASSWTWQGDPGGVLTVRLERVPGYPEMRSELGLLMPEAARARALVIDLRGQPPMREDAENVGEELGAILGDLAPKGLVTPAERVVQHSGYPSQKGTTDEYRAGLLTVLPVDIPEGASGSPERRIALVVDASSPLPAVALAFQRTGLLRIVAEGPLDERTAVRSQQIDLAPSLHARIRTGELDSPVRADAQAPPGQGTSAALAWVESRSGPTPPPLPTRPEASPRPVVWHRDKTYSEMLAPDRAYRLLALIRFWNVIDRFYPYKRLLDRPWDAVLRDFISRFAQAEGADGYARAVLEMSAQIQDSHVWVDGDSIRPITGENGPGLALQVLDGRPVVIEVDDPDAAAHGVRIGDVILEIDGEPLLARAARFEKYAAASRPLGRLGKALAMAMGGATDSTATLKLEGEGGVRTVTLKRAYYPPPSKPPFRLLDGDIGYVDLTSLNPGEVDAMFEKLGSAKALVFDMRGYPRGTAWSIAPRINVKKAARAAWFERNFLSGDLDEEHEASTFKFQKRIPAGTLDKPVYKGRIVMLIDENAVSQSEHSGLMYEAATDITYVGSPTAGANGDVTVLTLPGGISVSFTGHDVRHADGRQLQRIGLEPQVRVRPTIAGIRAGRDEVLERALKFLAEGK